MRESYFRSNIFSTNWQDQLKAQVDLVHSLKEKSQDAAPGVESSYAVKLSQRVATIMKDPSLVEVIDSCLPEPDRIVLVKNLIRKLMGHLKGTSQQVIQTVLKVILAVLTEGVVTAPIDGLPSVSVLEDSSVKLEFAGPIRAAGGTIMGLVVVVAEYLRRMMNFSVYHPTPQQVKRGVVEILSYIRAHPTQVRPSKQQITFVLENCPIMIDAKESERQQVSIYKYLPRIQKPRIRGAVALVVVEGIIIRAPKILSAAKNLDLDLEWVKQLQQLGKKYRSAQQRTSDSSSKYSLSIGRPVISSRQSTTGLRLRVGTTPTLGLSSCNVNPLLIDLLGFINVGSQLVVSLPGKGATISGTCSDLERPKVRYASGVAYYEPNSRDQVLEILELGEVMFSVGDFVEFQKSLPIRDYCRGMWRRDTNYEVNVDQLDQKKALQLFEKYPKAKLVPSFALNLENLDFRGLMYLREVYDRKNGTFEKSDRIISLLNKLGVLYDLKEVVKVTYPLILGHYLSDKICLSYQEYLNFVQKIDVNDSKQRSHLTGYLNFKLKQSNLQMVPEKGLYCIYARVGRAQSVNVAKLKPKYCYSLAEYVPSGYFESFWSAVQKNPYASVSYYTRRCFGCEVESVHRLCQTCGLQTEPVVYCRDCKVYVKTSELTESLHKAHDLKQFTQLKRNYLREIELIKDLGLPVGPLSKIKRLVPLKLKSSSRSVKYPQSLLKGYLRCKRKLSVTKDGTVRVSHPNLLTTHFVPRQCEVELSSLLELGYEKDVEGKPLTSVDQIVVLKPHDVIISKQVYQILKDVSKFLDQLLMYGYDFPHTYYNVNCPKDLIGHSIYSISPHTSIAAVNRIVGYTDNLGIYYHPLVIACRRRDADGDMDSCGLVLDLYLNMSKSYVDSNKIGALMSVPLNMAIKYPLDNIGKEVLNRQVGTKYYEQLDFTNLKSYTPAQLKTVNTIGSFLERGQLYPAPESIGYNTPNFHTTTGNSVNLYRDSQSNKKKVDLVLKLEEKLTGVDQTECIIGLIEGHIIPDMVGNLNAYFRQTLKCNSCGYAYECDPLSTKCLKCTNGVLKQTVYPNMVMKYYDLLEKLQKECEIPLYLKQKIAQIKSSVSFFLPKSNKLKDLFSDSDLE